MPKKQQNILHSSEYSYQRLNDQLFENTKEGMFVIDFQGEIVFVSKSVEIFLNYSVSDLIGKKIINYIHQDNIVEIKTICEQINLLQDGTTLESVKIKTNEGSFINLRIELFNYNEKPDLKGVLGRFKVIQEPKNVQLDEFNLNKWDDLKTLVETTSAGILINNEKEILYANNAFTQNLGPLFDHKKLSLEAFIRTYVREDYVDTVLERATQRFNDNKQVPNKYEVPIIDINGQEKWVELYAKLINYKNSKVVVVTVNDITGRKKALTELERRESNLKIINHFATSIIGSMNEYGILKDIIENCISHLGFQDAVIYLVDPIRKKLYQKLGYSSRNDNAYLSGIELEFGQGIVGAVAETMKSILVEDVTKDERYLSDTIDAGSELAVPIILENRIYGVIDSENTNKNYYSKNHQYLLETVAYLSSIKIAKIHFQNDLLVKEIRHNAVIDAIPDIVVRINENGMLLDFVDNSNSLSLSDLKLQGLQVKESPIKELFTTEIMKAVRQAINTKLAKTVIFETNFPQSNQIYEARIVKSGEDEAVTIIRNVSESIQNKKELESFNAKLSDTNEELKATLNELSDKNFELDQLMYKTSHDLRSPLRSMLGLVDILYNEKDSKKIEEYLNYIKQLINRLDNFIHDMLDYGKNSRTEVVVSNVSFKDILESCFNDLTYLDNYSKVKKDVNIVGETRKFMSDPQKLKMIFNNIISNAYRYYDFTKDQSFLNITINITRNDAKVIIEDNGIGIAKDKLEKVFNMFYRATNRVEGTGLGLYIVKQTIEKLKGNIQIDSELYQGTTFKFNLPNLE